MQKFLLVICAITLFFSCSNELENAGYDISDNIVTSTDVVTERVEIEEKEIPTYTFPNLLSYENDSRIIQTKYKSMVVNWFVYTNIPHSNGHVIITSFIYQDLLYIVESESIKDYIEIDIKNIRLHCYSDNKVIAIEYINNREVEEGILFSHAFRTSEAVIIVGYNNGINDVTHLEHEVYTAGKNMTGRLHGLPIK
jgi:hypothetical protein